MTERTVTFHSKTLGVRLQRGNDGVVRVFHVSPSSSSGAFRVGIIEKGDVLCEVIGIANLRQRALNNSDWKSVVSSIQAARRPLAFVVKSGRQEQPPPAVAATGAVSSRTPTKTRQPRPSSNQTTTRNKTTTPNKKPNRGRSWTPPRPHFFGGGKNTSNDTNPGSSNVDTTSTKYNGSSKGDGSGNTKRTSGLACLIPQELKFIGNHSAGDNEKNAYGKRQQQQRDSLIKAANQTWLDEDDTAADMEAEIFCGDTNQMMLVSQISLDPDLLALESEAEGVDFDPFAGGSGHGFEVLIDEEDGVDDPNLFDFSFSDIVTRHQKREQERFQRQQQHFVDHQPAMAATRYDYVEDACTGVVTPATPYPTTGISSGGRSSNTQRSPYSNVTPPRSRGIGGIPQPHYRIDSRGAPRSNHGKGSHQRHHHHKNNSKENSNSGNSRNSGGRRGVAVRRISF